MRKHGFTMAELLIALGIIGVAAALIAPAISDVMPDKNKIKVLNYHAKIADVTNELLDTNWIYYSDPMAENPCEGLECTEQPLMAPYNSGAFSSDNKYQNLLFDKLGIENGVHPDGSLWQFRRLAGDDGVEYQIRINVDGEGADERIFSMSESRKINTFMFTVDKYGSVSGDDPLTKAYLSNPLNSHSKKEDYQRAEGFVEDN